jgi:uncharacterized protein YdeI (YjbR/CyaY-like superfamily)
VLIVQLRKKRSAAPGITHPQALEIALCFGWIDGQVSALDDDYFLQAFTPRRARRVWSQLNRDSALALIAQGRMRAAGLAEVDRAKADGRWEAAYRQKESAVPPDLQAAHDASPAAAAFFRALTAQNRFALLFRLDSVRRAETGASRIATYIGMLERGETLYPQKPREPRDTRAPESPQDAPL